jgi:ATP-binding cassette subfamily B protein
VNLATLIYNGFVSLAVAFGAWQCITLAQAGAMPVSDVALVFFSIMMINAYTKRMGEILLTMQRSINDMEDAVIFARLPVEAQGGDEGFEFKDRLSLEGLRFTYNAGGAAVLDIPQLVIPKGQKIGLVGHSGAGKSTLVSLLLRFYEAGAGAIEIDGRNIKDLSLAALRSHIAVIPQDTTLFHRSLRENIAYGLSDATEQQILEAAQKAHADEFITALPHGYDTLVGERGVKLSGGQRQRIAIARAILKDAPILILDEATSALDSHSEKLIQDSLKTLMESKTVIAIAHRLSTIAHLDRLIIMDQGRIVEDGTHDELLICSALGDAIGWVFNGINMWMGKMLHNNLSSRATSRDLSKLPHYRSFDFAQDDKRGIGMTDFLFK